MPSNTSINAFILVTLFFSIDFVGSHVMFDHNICWFLHTLFAESLLRTASKRWKQVRHPFGLFLVQVTPKIASSCEDKGMYLFWFSLFVVMLLMGVFAALKVVLVF